MDPERFGAYLERVHSRLDKAQVALSGGEFTGESDDERIVATVNAQGHLTGLEIDPRVFRRPDSEGLAQAILQAAERARTAGVEQSRAVLRDIVGVDFDPDEIAATPDPAGAFQELGRQLRERAEREGES